LGTRSSETVQKCGGFVKIRLFRSQNLKGDTAVDDSRRSNNRDVEGFGVKAKVGQKVRAPLRYSR